MTTLVTRESLQQMLSNSNQQYVAKVIGRALIALMTRQTQAEQATNETKEHNNVGFASCDARSATLTAKYFMKHGHLEAWQVERWTRVNKNGVMRLAKYWKQLNQIAAEKAR